MNQRPQAFIALYNTLGMFQTNERSKCLSQKSSLTLCVLQYPFHQDWVFCDALSDQQNTFWNSSASSQKITISELNKILKLFILLEFFKEANSFFVMATEFSVYFLHFICIFF